MDVMGYDVKVCRFSHSFVGATPLSHRFVSVGVLSVIRESWNVTQEFENCTFSFISLHLID